MSCFENELNQWKYVNTWVDFCPKKMEQSFIKSDIVIEKNCNSSEAVLQLVKKQLVH